jgi:hypothetical protein
MNLYRGSCHVFWLSWQRLLCFYLTMLLYINKCSYNFLLLMSFTTLSYFCWQDSCYTDPFLIASYAP